MPPKRVLSSATGQETKKQCKSLTIEEKMGVIRRMEKGETRSDVCRAFNLAPSTVTTIMKNAETTKVIFPISSQYWCRTLSQHLFPE
jgi:DNA-binding NarL/FixJ family response regulator